MTESEDFKTRLKIAKSKIKKQSDHNNENRGLFMGNAFKLGTELVAAVGVGTIIGFILDSWFDTKPWLIIIFFFLGAAAGMLNSRADLKLSIFNRGISGNKVHQLDARWQSDCLAHKPDILSILIGVNDIWHGFQGKYDGTVDRYEEDYLALVDRTREALPDIQLVICEPFVLKCGAVSSKWFPEFDLYRKAARRVADSHAATFVPFQSMFDQALSFAPPQHWARDGVHPTAHGSALMADCWLQAVRG